MLLGVMFHITSSKNKRRANAASINLYNQKGNISAAN
jgi:hypothetical protein